MNARTPVRRKRKPPIWFIILAVLLSISLACAPIVWYWRTSFPGRHASHDSMAAQITALFKTDGSKAQQAAQRSGDKDITVDAEQNPMRGAGFHSISITQNGYTIRIRDFDVSDKYATHGKGIDIIGFNMHRKNDTDTGAGMKLSNDSVSIDQDDCKDFLSHTGLKQKQAEHMCEQSLQYLLNTLADNW